MPTTLSGGVRSTTSNYDLLGRLWEQRDLGATHLDGSTSARRVSQTHDAWGNTLAAGAHEKLTHRVRATVGFRLLARAVRTRK